MWPDRVSNPGPLTYKSDALPTVLHGSVKIYWLLALITTEILMLSFTVMYKFRFHR